MAPGGDQLALVLKRRFPIVGGGAGVWSLVHVDDAAATTLMTEIRGASNAKARRELGWAPAHPSWREGFPATLGTG